ncbi:MAG: MBOAT family protein [Verrucomicrobia bacterium]|nr:MBOAT family protein [Verrucomicrobiota bacterium]
MVFSSVLFLFFFLPLVLAIGLPLQALANRRDGRGWALGLANLWLLVASVVFYAWGEVYLVWVMVASCLLNYAGGFWCAPGRPGRRAALVAVVTANLALLAWYKYSGLAVELLNRCNAALGHLFGADIRWTAVVLPLGISFYTFHGISYVVDVWRGKVVPCRSLRDFLCYSTLFPQLVAGPIVRYSEVGEQFSQRRVGWDDLAEGARRFIAGLGKKVLIANQVAPLADAIFALPEGGRSAAAAWVGVTAYALQIFFDFSGYSDMAVGLGRMFGFRFPENFDHPYVAGSMRDFWRRWHMTLSRFFRDYLYIPLGGNRHGAVRTAVNLLAVFALCGLWHGASWNFLAWGLFHGVFLATERVLEPVTERTPGWLRPLGHVYTLVAVLLSWVIFRCDTWAQTLGYFRSMAGTTASGGFTTIPAHVVTTGVLYALGAGLVLCTPVWPALRARFARWTLADRALEVGEVVAALAILVLCLLSMGAVTPGGPRNSKNGPRRSSRGWGTIFPPGRASCSGMGSCATVGWASRPRAWWWGAMTGCSTAGR